MFASLMFDMTFVSSTQNLQGPSTTQTVPDYHMHTVGTVYCSMRHQVDLLLLALWADPACKTSLAAVAQAANASQGSTGASHLVDYARAVLNNLMYTLKVGAHRIPLC